MKKQKGTKIISFVVALFLVVSLVLGVLGGSVSSASSSLRKENAKLKEQIESVQKENTELKNENTTIKDKNSLLESNNTTLQEEVNEMYNYQYSLDIDFYVDSVLYISGKARNGGTLLVSPAEPTKDGYTFKGWSLSEDGEVVDLASTTFTTNKSLYAVFEKEEEPVTTETWVLNETLTDFDNFSVDINFTSNGENYTNICITKKGYLIDYVNDDGAFSVTSPDGWLDDAYRIITFDSLVTDETLLSWLESNAIKINQNTEVITFTIEGKTYFAENGMTWRQWCSSSYNTDGYYEEYTQISGPSGDRIAIGSDKGALVSYNDTIINNEQYYYSSSGGAAQ